MARSPQMKQKAHASPGFAAANPMFPAVASMETDLGHTNQFILVNEIAMRELKSAAENNQNGIEPYVAGLSKKHGIRVSLNQFNAVNDELPRWYTMLVATEVDRSLRHLIKDIKLLKNFSGWIGQRGGENLSALEQLQTNLPTGSSSLEACPEYAALEYYRLVRNEFVHTPREHARPTIDAHAALVEKFGDYLRDRYKTRGAPNAPDNLSFDDFFLQTQIARDFAIVISDAYNLTIDDILRVVSADQEMLRRAKATGGPHRFRNCYYDYYIKRHARWNDAVTDRHANAFADSAFQQLR